MAIAGHCNLRPPGLPPDPPPAHPSIKLSCPKNCTWSCLSVCKISPSSSNSFRDTRGSKICTRGRCTPRTPLGWKFSCPERVLGPVYICIKFQLSICNSFRDMTGSQIYLSVAPTVLGVGGPTHPKFGVMVDLSSVLDKFVFVFR